MSLFHALILGLVQGVTEFLPISSSGFLILIPELFGWELQSLSFDVIVHLATLAAVIVAMWDEMKKWRTIFWWIVFATIPIVIVGFFVQEMVEVSFRSIEVVGWSFIIWGVVLFLADRYAKSPNDKIEKVGRKRALVIGFAQILALIPGTSRSGITITAGLFGGLSRETAARFSFLLGIPTIAAAGLLKLVVLYQSPTSIDVLPLLIGFAAAFISAFLTIKIFLAFLKQNTYMEIALFRIVLGALILVM